jgi:hypothetical protein
MRSLKAAPLSRKAAPLWDIFKNHISVHYPDTGKHNLLSNSRKTLLSWTTRDKEKVSERALGFPRDFEPYARKPCIGHALTLGTTLPLSISNTLRRLNDEKHDRGDSKI